MIYYRCSSTDEWYVDERKKKLLQLHRLTFVSNEPCFADMNNIQNYCSTKRIRLFLKSDVLVRHCCYIRKTYDNICTWNLHFQGPDFRIVSVRYFPFHWTSVTKKKTIFFIKIGNESLHIFGKEISFDFIMTISSFYRSMPTILFL